MRRGIANSPDHGHAQAGRCCPLASPHDPSRPADCSRRAGHHKRSALTAAMSGRWMRCFCPDSRWLEHGRGVVPRIWMPHEYIGPGPARVLRPRAHAGRKRPAGHLARPLDDGRLLDATRNLSLSHRTHQAKLPERRPEAGPWQDRRGPLGLTLGPRLIPNMTTTFVHAQTGSPGCFWNRECHF